MALANIAIEFNDYDFALELAEDAIVLSPEDDNGYIVLGKVYRAQKLWQKAIDSYDRYPRLKTANLFAETAYVFLTLRKYESSWEAINMSIRMHKMFGDKAPIARLEDLSKAYSFRAILNVIQGLCSDARRDIKEATSINRFHPMIPKVIDMVGKSCNE